MMYWLVSFCLLLELVLITNSIGVQCFQRRAWRRDRKLGRVYRPAKESLMSTRSKGQDMDCIVKNAEKNARIRVVPFNDLQHDVAGEAAMRHEMEKFYPKLQLCSKSITNDNYKTVKSRFKHLQAKHPAKEPPLAERPHKQVSLFFCVLGFYLLFRVTFEDTCFVFLVYATDPCRGESNEKEENTADEALNPNVS
ncbi:hypothetical protein M3Y97_00225300 [Aphelenchoides bicaudatus]|nr:hypothetical protein M3Y97_00225300 [Aphelenchoides bicaudatus]